MNHAAHCRILGVEVGVMMMGGKERIVGWAVFSWLLAITS